MPGASSLWRGCLPRTWPAARSGHTAARPKLPCACCLSVLSLKRSLAPLSRPQQLLQAAACPAHPQKPSTACSLPVQEQAKGEPKFQQKNSKLRQKIWNQNPGGHMEVRASNSQLKNIRFCSWWKEGWKGRRWSREGRKETRYKASHHPLLITYRLSKD